MINKLKIIILLFACSFSQGSCQQKNDYLMNKFEWTPTNTAPKNYPVYLYRGYFTGTDDSLIKTPDKQSLYFGWQNTGSVYISGEDLKPVPQKLTATWLSYAETKYYKIDIELPAKKIGALFNNGYTNPRTGKKETFSTISYGIAPGGFVVVWLVGTAYRIEVASGQGHVTKLDFKEMIPTTNLNEREYIDFKLKNQVEDTELKQIKDGNIPFDRWKNYRRKYNWKMALSNTEEFVPEQARITMLNGEQDVQYFDKNIKSLLNTWAIPSSARIQWQDKNGNLFAAKLLFDEQETIEAFDTLFRESKEDAVLTAHISTFNETIKITLRDKENEIELKKAKIKIYSKTD